MTDESKYQTLRIKNPPLFKLAKIRAAELGIPLGQWVETILAHHLLKSPIDK